MLVKANWREGGKRYNEINLGKFLIAYRSGNKKVERNTSHFKLAGYL